MDALVMTSGIEEGGEELSFSPQADVHTADLKHLELSATLRGRLVNEGLGDEEINSLLKVEPVAFRPQDDSYPLSCYFISTSHNTYLLSRQLLGTASSSVYKHVIERGCRCVEIDAWDSEAGPIVTHGLTLTSTTPFQDVCEAIGSAVRENDWPLMISLENHADAPTQAAMVKIMTDTWGSKLVNETLEDFGPTVTPQALKGRILLIVEWYPDDPEPGEEYEEDEKGDHKESVLQFLHIKKKAEAEKPAIIPELAALAVYAQSIKPKQGFLLEPDPADPTHRFLNLSESAMSSILPHLSGPFITRAAQRQVRIYPKGTRIESANYNPVPYWRGGAQICAQNWQRFDRGMQLTRAMFEGSEGWLLKPPSLLGKHRKGHEPPPKDLGLVTFSCEVFGASGVPLAKPLKEGEHHKVYIIAQLFHEDGDRRWQSTSVPALLSPSSGTDGIDKFDISFDPSQKFEWDFDANKELTFLRLMIVHNVMLEEHVKLATYTVDLELHKPGLQALRLLNPGGELTNAGLLVKTSLIPRAS